MTETDSHLNARRLNATIPEPLAGRRFDQALAELFPDFSRSRLTAWRSIPSRRSSIARSAG